MAALKTSTSLPRAEDKKLIKKLQDVLRTIKSRDLTHLIRLLSKEDRPDLNYLVPLRNRGSLRIHREWVSPLQYACEKGTPEMAGALLAAGAMVNIKPHSPLTYAIFSYKVELVHRLLQSGARPMESLFGDPNGSDIVAAMHLKRHCDIPDGKQQQREIITMLCKAGCDVNACVVANRSLGSITILNQAKGIRKVETAYQPPLLFHVVSEGDLELCKVFLESGADVNAKDSMYKETALYIAITSQPEENLPLVELLLTYGADPNQSKDGVSLLHLAVKRKMIGTTKALVQAGANRAAQDNDGCTPLHYAASEGQAELVTLLALPEILNAPDKNGLTALHKASDNGSLATVRALAKAGADVDVKTPVTEVSPIDMALHNNHQNVAQFLKKLKGKNDLLECDGPVTHSSMPEIPTSTATTASDPKTKELQEENQTLKEKLKKQDEETEQLRQEISRLQGQLKDQETENDRMVASLQKQLQKFEVIQYEENANPVPMSDSHKQALTTNWPRFLEDLHHSVVVPSLVAGGILTPHMEEEIIKAYHTRRDRNAHLLDTLLTRGDQAFYVFRQALRKDPGSAHLAMLLNVD